MNTTSSLRLGGLAIALAVTTSVASAQFLHAVAPIVSPGTMFHVATDRLNSRVIGVDTAGATLVLSYGATNTWTQILPPNPALATIDSQIASPGTGSANVLFYDGVNQRAFELTDGGWVAFPTTGNPSQRTAFAMVGLANGDVILHGGQTQAGTFLGGTFRLSGSTWTPVTGGPNPGVRSGAAMARDPAGALLFGGFNGVTPFNDTWQLVGSTWTNLGIPGPTARMFAGLELHERDGEHVLIGGFDTALQVPLNDAFVLRGGAWLPIATAPAGMTLGFMSAALEPNQDEVVVVETLFGPAFGNTVSGGINSGAGCGCPPTGLPLGLTFAGTSTLGGTFAVGFTGFPAGGAVILFFGTGLLDAPQPIPGFPAACTQFLQNIQGGIVVVGAPVPVFVPASVSLIGTVVTHQAADFVNLCVSDALETRVGR